MLMNFEVNKKYCTRSANDSNCEWTYTVQDRTAKTLTLVDDEGQSIKVRIKICGDEEICKPLGTYSMSPTLRASKVKQ